MTVIKKIFRKWRSDESGTAVIEAIIIFPILSWALVAMTVYFDAFRTRSVNLKAAFTISDLLSRQKGVVDAPYIEGLHTIFNSLISPRHSTWIRTTLIRFEANDVDDPNDDEHIVVWSYATGPADEQTDTSILTVENRIPVMGNGDTAIIVETHTNYVPTFDIGLPSTNMDQFIVTRPRFGSPCWETCIN